MANFSPLLSSLSAAVDDYHSIVGGKTCSDEDMYAARMTVAAAAKSLYLEADDPMRRIFRISRQVYTHINAFVLLLTYDSTIDHRECCTPDCH